MTDLGRAYPITRISRRYADIPARQKRCMGWLLGIIAASGFILLSVTGANYEDFFLFLGFYTLLSAAAALCIGVSTRRICKARAPAEPETFSYIPWLGVAAVLTAMTITSFLIFKQFILPPRGFPLDPALAAFDRLIFFGNDPWTFTHKFFGSWQASKLLDLCYTNLWFILMYCFPALAITLGQSYEIRLRLVTCWLTSWIFIGSFAAWIFGSAGPCYYNALVGHDASFAILNQRLAALGLEAHNAGITIRTLGYQPQLLSTFLNPRLEAVGGISAMPSMHVAMAALFAIGGFQIRRWLGWVMTGFTLLIWIGSVHFGWHYASDGVVGAAMMIILWKATALLTSKYLRFRHITANN